MLGGDGTIIPNSRTISVATGEHSTTGTRVISSSRLLSDGGGGRSMDGTLDSRAGDRSATQQLSAVIGRTRNDKKKGVVTGDKLQHGKRTADIHAVPVPPHKRPRRTKAGAGSLAGAA